MSRRDMERSAWTRVLAKKQIIRDFVCGEHRGKISLLKILKISEPFRRSYDGRPVVLADAGFFWLQLALDGERAWFTVMFDETGKLLQIYADVTDGNEALSDNPTFEDMYLDYVVHEGSVYELDRDELEEAYAAGRISKEQYGKSLAAGARIYQKLTEDREAIEAFFAEQFEKLRPELEREAQDRE